MALALSLGRRELGRVWPNPAVGCVIVSKGRIVGRGWTQQTGRPHAETVALEQAGEASRGATAYVTLEPCSHHGHTPPCARALIDSGISRVVVATGDPDPRVNGQGIAMLRDAGIRVETGLMESRSISDNIGFIQRVTKKTPFVTLKLAASLDGRIATSTGESKWITGPESRRLVHAMRARHDAVMVGGGTARADDPSLSVRGLGMSQQPVRVVWSRHLDLPITGALARSAQDVPLWICHASDANQDLKAAWSGLGARLIECDTGPDRQMDPRSCLRSLALAGLTRVFCEGGGALAASILRSDLVNELVVFRAGLAIGAEGYPMLGAMGLDGLAQARRFRLIETRRIGADAMTRWTP